MGEGKFKQQVQKVGEIFSDLGLVQLVNSNVSYSDDMPAAVRKKIYRHEWEHYIQGRHFDLLLVDWSLFQFKLPKKGSSDLPGYCYFDCPVDVVSYERFLREYVGLSPEEAEGDEDSFWEEYEEYVFSASPREHVTPLRFDNTPQFYNEGDHPAAHIHIGRKNEIRLLTERIMEPLSFGLFVLRQIYPKKWLDFLKTDNALTICRSIRESLVDVDKKFYTELDKLQLVLR